MILSCLICMAMLFLSMAGAAADTAPDYSWFAGPEKGTYTISDAADLLGLANIVNGTDGQTKYNFAGQAVELDAKIDLAGLEWTPIGMGSNWFCGEFDGNGYTISNMTITSTASTVHLGLFGRTTKAYIHDFVMENPSITATGSNIRAGAVAAYAGIPDKLDGWTVIEDVSISNSKVWR